MALRTSSDSMLELKGWKCRRPDLFKARRSGAGPDYGSPPHERRRRGGGLIREGWGRRTQTS